MIEPTATRPSLTLIVPAYNEEANIAETVRRVYAEAKRLVPSHEIIVVDDGSIDGTFAAVKTIGEAIPVHLLRLSRNFGKEQAIMAGLQASRGAAVVILDADLQEPLHYLETMLAHRARGYEMVYAVRVHRGDERFAKRMFTRVFYKFINFGAEANIPENARDFRLMDRKVVDALCNLPERNRFMKGLYGWAGFRSIAVPIELAPRNGGMAALLANLCAFLVAFGVSFIGHYGFSFPERTTSVSTSLKRFTLVALGGFLMNESLLAAYLWAELGPANLGLMLSTGCAAVMTFSISRNWAFSAR